MKLKPNYKHFKVMTKLLYSVVFILFVTAMLHAEEGEIRVHLSTESSLSPLYIGNIEGANSSLSAQYLAQLESVLAFDLKYNGHTKVVPKSVEKEKILLQKENSQIFAPNFWKNAGISYVIKSSVSEKNLSLLIFSSQTGALKNFGEIKLTGDLNKDRRQIHKLADGIQKALFSVDGVASSRILYSVQIPNKEEKDWAAEIWECDWDGANARQVTKEESYCVTPVFIPASSGHATDRFLYVSYKMGQPKIFIASLNDSNGKRLIDLRGNQLLPAVSAKRDKVAFICDAAGRTDLFVQPLNASGEAAKPVQLFSYPRSTQASPTFSPDGSKIAFVSDKDGPPRIYLISATPTSKRQNPQLITKQNKESSCPSWSPDGRKLAYSAKTNGIRQIWIYDFASGEERQLTDGPGFKENPCWASDSMHIIFNSTDNASSELYLVNLNQPEAIKITKGPGKKHYPTWGTR
jgi:TolB protein